MTGYKLVMLKDLLEELGEDGTKSILSSFSCPLNADVEMFLRDKAILFEVRRFSSTYLIFASFRNELQLAGYFTLASKHFVIPDKATKSHDSRGKVTGPSKALIKKLKNFGTYDEMLKQHTISAPLIGQLGRNFASGDGDIKLITGDELLKIACDKVREGQSFFGGRFVYLECEDKPKLIDFYSDNGFVEFGKRNLESDERDLMSGEYLVQMLKDLKPKSLGSQ